MEGILTARGLTTSIAARRKAFMLRKLFDPLLLGVAPKVMCLDSDVLFFSRPTEILDWVTSDHEINLYNRDYPESPVIIPTEEVTARYGLTSNENLNAGLGLLCRSLFDLGQIDLFLRDPRLQLDGSGHWLAGWAVEQCVHRLNAGLVPTNLLSRRYLVSVEPGLTIDEGPVVARHYAGPSKPYLWSEGLPALRDARFVEKTDTQ